jgi:hypothetical protein
MLLRRDWRAAPAASTGGPSRDRRRPTWSRLPNRCAPDNRTGYAVAHLLDHALHAGEHFLARSPGRVHVDLEDVILVAALGGLDALDHRLHFGFADVDVDAAAQQALPGDSPSICRLIERSDEPTLEPDAHLSGVRLKLFETRAKLVSISLGGTVISLALASWICSVSSISCAQHLEAQAGCALHSSSLSLLSATIIATR